MCIVYVYIQAVPELKGSGIDCNSFETNLKKN